MTIAVPGELSTQGSLRHYGLCGLFIAVLMSAVTWHQPAYAVSPACQSIKNRLDSILKGSDPQSVRSFRAAALFYRLTGADLAKYQEACAGADDYLRHYTEQHELERRFIFECGGWLTTIGKERVDRRNVREIQERRMKPYWQDKAEICARTRGDNYDLIISDYSEAIRNDPGEERAYEGRAHAEYLKRDYDSAISDASKAIRINAKTKLAYQVRAESLEAKGDYKGAIPDRLELTRQEPTSAEAHNALCWGRAVAGIELKQALRSCYDALRWERDFGSAFNSLGLVNLKLGEFADAIQAYSKAIKIDPKDANSLYGRGLAKQKSDDAAGAKVDIGAATKLDPKIVVEFSKYNIEAAPNAVPTITQACADAKAHWEGVSAIDIVAGYEEHLKKFSSCNFAAEAKARIEKLRRAR